MCFSRRSFRREEQSREVHTDPTWEAFDREHDTERPQPTADREREQREAEKSREKVPAGIGA